MFSTCKRMSVLSFRIVGFGFKTEWLLVYFYIAIFLLVHNSPLVFFKRPI